MFFCKLQGDRVTGTVLYDHLVVADIFAGVVRSYKSGNICIVRFTVGCQGPQCRNRHIGRTVLNDGNDIAFFLITFEGQGGVSLFGSRIRCRCNGYAGFIFGYGNCQPAIGTIG